MAKFTIGFANMDEIAPFSIAVRESIQAAAAEHPDIDLVMRNNDLNDEEALRNVDEFVELGVDLAIISHVNERMGVEFQRRLVSTPVIAVDVPIQMKTYFGVDNPTLGRLAGKALTDWIGTHWGGQLDKLLVLTEYRVLDWLRSRVGETIQTLLKAFPRLAGREFFVDGGEFSTSFAMAYHVLETWQDECERIAVIGFVEDASLGATEAIMQLGMTDKAVVVGHMGSESLLDHLHDPESPVIAVTTSNPAEYGPRLLDLAERILNGERVSSHHYVATDLHTVDVLKKV
jgi:ABC-type sugar transport system substrate-binding protein